MYNIDVINEFVEKSPANTKSLHSTGIKLYSYNTCIAKWIADRKLVINVTKYSNTSTNHLNMLLRRLGGVIDYIEVNNIDSGSKDLPIGNEYNKTNGTVTFSL